MAFFEFDQNNSGGSFDIDDKRGIGPVVWIEATDVDGACDRAEDLGIYFNGCEDGRDCSCCGDRWYRPWREDGSAAPVINPEYNFSWHDTVYVHRIGGEIERVTLSSKEAA
jgi:hypothetical protein